MRKTIGIIALTLWASAAFTQIPQLPRDAEGKVLYSGVVLVDSTLKDQLQSAALLWVAKAFKSSEVVQIDDRQSGTLVLKSAIPVGGSPDWVYFDMSLYFKDGRYRYELTDFTHQSRSYGGDWGELGSIYDMRLNKNQVRAATITLSQTDSAVKVMLEGLHKELTKAPEVW